MGITMKNSLAISRWNGSAVAALDRDLELAVIDATGVVLLCRHVLRGWVNAGTNQPVSMRPMHWRELDSVIELPTLPLERHMFCLFLGQQPLNRRALLWIRRRLKPHLGVRDICLGELFGHWSTA
jgi:hypothetical protein